VEFFKSKTSFYKTMHILQNSYYNTEHVFSMRQNCFVQKELSVKSMKWTQDARLKISKIQRFQMCHTANLHGITT